METTTNPFEPPRTTDLETAPSLESLVLSEEALRELIATAPWLRWLTRLTSLSIAVGLVKGAVYVVRAIPNVKLPALLGIAIGAATWTAILVALRRYAVASWRLYAEPRDYAPRVIATQAGLFRRVGIVLCVCLGPVAFFAVVVLIMLIAGFVKG